MLKKLKPQSLPLYKRIWQESQTKALAYSQAISGGILFSASQVHDAVTNPTVKDALDGLTLPSWFPWVLLGLAALTYIAHGHGEDA